MLPRKEWRRQVGLNFRIRGLQCEANRVLIRILARPSGDTYLPKRPLDTLPKLSKAREIAGDVVKDW
jgi:hypothetical protein